MNSAHQKKLCLAREMYDLYIEAEKEVLLGNEYTIGNRSFKMANLTEIRKGQREWEAAVQRLEEGDSRGPKVVRVTMRD